jgi:hypothetical protein
MADQIAPSVTNPTIADIYDSIDTTKLILRPDFQRKFVWTREHQEQFIDTIQKGLPFPEIYTCKGETDVQKLRTTQNVIDGQQRLTTIKNYIEGIQAEQYKKIKPFAALTVDERRDFLEYKVVVRDIGFVDETTIREIFRRINLTKFQLENVEIQNAIYDGAYIATAKTILESVDLSEYGVFKESEFSRMADLGFVLLVMSTIDNDGYFTYDKDVESFVSRFNDEYPRSSEIASLLVSTFKTISDLGLEPDSIWFRKSSFYTFVVELAKNKNQIPENFKARLDDLGQRIMSGKNSSDDFGTYYKFMYSGTQNRSSRVKRGEIFRKYALEAEGAISL